MTEEPITVTPEDAPGVPAPDPEPETPSNGIMVPPYDRVFARYYATVIGAFGGNAKGGALKPYELKAADIALTLTQNVIYANQQS